MYPGESDSVLETGMSVRQNRRAFLRRGGAVAVGTMLGGSSLGIIGCDDRSPTGLAVPRPRPQLFLGTVFRPEEMSAWSGYAADAAPAIRQALQQAASAAGEVMLTSGKTYLIKSAPDSNNPKAGIDVLAGVRLYGSTGSGRPIVHMAIASQRLSVLMRLSSRIEYVYVKGYNSARDISSSGSGIESSASRWTVYNCEISHFPVYGINIGNPDVASHNGRIERTNIHHVGDAGIQVLLGCSNWTITQNTVTFVGRNGIDINGYDCSISYNTCNDCGQVQNNPDGNRASDLNGIYVQGSSAKPAGGNDIVNNTCDRNHRHGILTASNTPNSYVANNYCSDNYASGIAAGGSINLLVENNTSIFNGFLDDEVNDTGWGFADMGGNSGTVRYNEFAGNEAGAWICGSALTYTGNIPNECNG